MSNYMMVVPVLGIATWTIVMLVVLVVLIAALVVLSIYGRSFRNVEQSSSRQQELENASQNVSLLVIDKRG